jgi:hypothetical protein
MINDAEILSAEEVLIGTIRKNGEGFSFISSSIKNSCQTGISGKPDGLYCRLGS